MSKAKTNQPTAVPMRVKLVEAITTPLGFFVLALLIVEAFLASVIIGSNIDAKDKITGMWMGLALFVLVVTGVWVLVCWKPENLTFDKEAHLVDKGKITYGSDKKPITQGQLFSESKTEDNG